jgi:hypothetical protein
VGPAAIIAPPPIPDTCVSPVSYLGSSDSGERSEATEPAPSSTLQKEFFLKKIVSIMKIIVSNEDL